MNDSVTMHPGALGSTIHVPRADAGDDVQSALTAEAASDADTEEPAPPSGPETSPGGAVRRARPLRGAPPDRRRAGIRGRGERPARAFPLPRRPPGDRHRLIASDRSYWHEQTGEHDGNHC